MKNDKFDLLISALTTMQHLAINLDPIDSSTVPDALVAVMNEEIYLSDDQFDTLLRQIRHATNIRSIQFDCTTNLPRMMKCLEVATALPEINELDFLAPKLSEEDLSILERSRLLHQFPVLKKLRFMQMKKSPPRERRRKHALSLG